MKKALLSMVLGISVISCSNIKKDYIITDASYLPAPKWVKKGKYETSKKMNINILYQKVKMLINDYVKKLLKQGQI
ncbi:MAG: hypothetical protein J6C50_02350 [Rickettsiales bacterium]|nr:hypothetical protein [Rickettsiales bacterium]